MSKKKELGKGIRALLSNIDNKAPEAKQEVVNELSQSTAEIDINSIEANPWQPRTKFDEQAMFELVESIKVHGIIQPLTVRRLNNETFQLISGERRLKASKLAGLKMIPVYIRLANDQEMLEMALIENIQRQDLNAMEVAISYQRLMDECNLTHDKLSERVGKNRSTVTNYIRLLKLSPSIQRAIKEKKISMGHARALAGIENLILQQDIFNEVMDRELSVRATEHLIRAAQNPQPKASKEAKSSALSPEYISIQNDLTSRFGTKVSLKANKKGKGQIVINFSNTKQLNNILEELEED
jgi:ParB family chromosome partitioning protein